MSVVFFSSVCGSGMNLESALHTLHNNPVCLVVCWNNLTLSVTFGPCTEQFSYFGGIPWFMPFLVTSVLKSVCDLEPVTWMATVRKCITPTNFILVFVGFNAVTNIYSVIATVNIKVVTPKTVEHYCVMNGKTNN